MRVCAAQVRSIAGNVLDNINQHKKLIGRAISHDADLIIFPELSLTGYEPSLSKELAASLDDSRFDEFQKISNTNGITIGVGMPLRGPAGILIGMIIFQRNATRQSYCKQYLHDDELPYFTNAQDDMLLALENIKIAPAICYESLLPKHSEKAAKNGANIYFASVAKSSRGVEKAKKHMPEIASKHSMTVLMSNSVGPCDNFISVGGTAVWNEQGVLLNQLDSKSEGILIFDTTTSQVMVETLC